MKKSLETIATTCNHPTTAGTDLSRRRFMAWSSLAVAAGFFRFPTDAEATAAGRCEAIPLEQVRLAPSLFLDSLHVNLRYLLQLEPDRLLHNFREYAGLSPKGAVYGGWESDTIAGHTLGHYLSALSKFYAQTGNPQCLLRVNYIVDQLHLCQEHGGDGYVAGLTRRNAKGKIETGRKVFEEVARGEIHSSGFDLNGSWSPLYTVHKLFAGLLDANAYCNNPKALRITTGFANYLGDVFDKINDTQMQKVLVCEFGGLNESFAELYSRTQNPRWLKVTERLRHHAVIDPLVLQHDDLPHLHANTQIPKLIGMARQYEVSGNREAAAAARFFWETVTQHYSYVIGGNADREYFQQPDTTAKYLTEETCEHCNSYNMLKLTRHMYQWTPQARFFDYYERTLHNHIMAQQNPKTGMFTYMTPTITAGKRGFSDPFDSFWCCVGTGMESHSQFADSIYWQDGNSLYVNLYIPSTLDWEGHEFKLAMTSELPLSGGVKLVVERAGKKAPQRLALRIPAWTEGRYELKLNGRTQRSKASEGYAVIERIWREGDTVTLALATPLRLESTVGDANTVTVMRGPIALAADLGPVSQPYDQADPTLVADGSPLEQFKPSTGATHFAATSTRPSGLQFVPFFAQYERRSALYFRRMNAVQWQKELTVRAAKKASQAKLAQNSVDSIEFGDDVSERAHELTSDVSFAGSYRRQKCRDARGGGFVAFNMKNAPGPLTLRLRFWGSDGGRFRILVNGKVAVEVPRSKSDIIDFVDRDYALPSALLTGKTLRIRIEPVKGDTAGPLFGGWLMTTASAEATSG
ncbi:glycoside hydrolase family 127 protein [Rhodanobacter glycinis]|uniref:Glycoside hydrolase family 127 protein n=1 Tax=Rhodanobacter glycinis TaxID=582702 RepID=A0A5B9DY05_9GAMM|nr:glycoside hydrolase family 127 protein [Rhodanobacter glycinis]QEE24409.1 glycoside hydrolase family 127 protein [Rhodanobacter glycinis]